MAGSLGGLGAQRGASEVGVEHHAGGVDHGEQRGFEVAGEGGLGSGDDVRFRRRSLAGGDPRPRPVELVSHSLDDGGPRVARHSTFEAGIARYGVDAGQLPVAVAGMGAAPGPVRSGASRAYHGVMVAQGPRRAPFP